MSISLERYLLSVAREVDYTTRTLAGDLHCEVIDRRLASGLPRGRPRE